LIPLLLGGLFLVIRESIKGLVVLFKRDSIVSVSVSIALSAVLATFLEATVVTYYEGPSTILADVAQRRAEKVLRLPIYDFIAQRLPASSAFIADQDPLFYLYTGHHARSLHSPPTFFYHGDEQAALRRYYSLAQFGREHNLEYLFFTSNDFYRQSREDLIRSIVRGVVRNEADFELVREDPGGSVYKINNPRSVHAEASVPSSRRP